MTNIYEIFTGIHQSVRYAIEREYECVVTSIEGTAETHYAPTKNSKAYIMSNAAMTFQVEAQQGALAMSYKVAVDNSGDLRTLSSSVRLG